MAYPLGAHYDTPHGVANALLLPYIMEYNAASPAAPKYTQIVKAMGVDIDGMSEEDLHQLAIDAFNEVNRMIVTHFGGLYEIRPNEAVSYVYLTFKGSFTPIVVLILK